MIKGNSNILYLHDRKTGLIWAALFFLGCKEPYAPPALKNSVHYLVVDGFINAGNDSTRITLSRTRNFKDTVPNAPELNAQVSVIGESGDVYSLPQIANGQYGAAGLNLNQQEKYKLQILTSDGNKYLSDAIPVTATPSIDSISWKQDTSSSDNKLGVSIYANTHDASNQTRYYRWEYEETWEHRAAYFSLVRYVNHAIIPRDPLSWQCWSYFSSTDLLQASSAKLGEDVIFEFPLVFIPVSDIKLSVRYSILVKQYAMTREAFEYWENLKKNTELRGSIFDAQPSQVVGNMHCISNPNEPVLGYISATTRQQQRIFIKNTALAHWGYDANKGCEEVIVPGTNPDSLEWYFRIRGYEPVANHDYFNLLGTNGFCVDCRAQGGSLNKPDFW